MHGSSRQGLAAARQQLTALAAGRPDLAPVGEGLFSVVRLLDREGRLRRTLGDPTSPAAAKESLLDALLGRQVDPLPLTVLKQAVGQRWSSPRDLVDAVEVLAVTAVFLVAEADGTLDDVEDELFRFARIIARDPALRAVLTDRALGAQQKTDLLQSLLADRVHPATYRLVVELVLSPRGRTLEDGLEDFAALAAQVRERTLATVTTAVPLDPGQEQRLAAALSRQLGREVQLQVEVDPGVLGGVVVHVGDEVIDGSILHRLDDARRRLTR